MENDRTADQSEIIGENTGDVDWQAVIESNREQLETAETSEARFDLLVRIAEIYESALNERQLAIETYVEALEYDPESKAVSATLVQLYIAQGEVQKAADQLHELCSVETDPVLLGQYYGQLAMLYRDELEDLGSAVDFLGLTLDAQFSHVAAFEAIAEILREGDDLVRLEEELVAMIERTSELTTSLRRRLRAVREALGKNLEDAAPMIEDSGLLSVTHTHSQTAPPAPIGAPPTPAQTSTPTEAPAPPILPLPRSTPPPSLEPDLTKHLWVELAEHEAAEEWHLASETLGRILEHAKTALEKVDILYRRGQIIQHKIRDNASAEVFYQDALSHDFSSAKTLAALLEIRIETRDYKRAINLIERLVDTETDEQKLAEYHFTAATIYRDELENPQRAVEHYNRTLDHNLDKLKAFEAVDRLLTRQGAWEELAHNYERMIARLGSDSRQHELLFMLNKNLGEIYRSRMKQFEPAIAAFETALRHRPNDAVTQEMICQLLELNSDHSPVYLEKAVRQFHRLLTLTPENYATYESLANLYMKLDAVDRAWCICGVMEGLRTGTEMHREYFAAHRNTELPTLSQNDGDVWARCLYPRGMNLHLSRVMAELNTLIREMRGDSLKQYAKRRHRIELGGRDHLGVTIGQVFYLLALPHPEVYLVERIGSADVPPADTPALRISKTLQEADPKTIAFYVAYHGTFLMSQFNTALYGDKLFLTNCFNAALRSVLPSQQVPVNDEMNRILVALEGLSQKSKTRLQSIVGDLMTTDAQVNMQEWLEHVEMTALRAAVMACNDFEHAVTLLNDRIELRHVSRERALTDMAWFATSESYFELREDLGLTLKS